MLSILTNGVRQPRTELSPLSRRVGWILRILALFLLGAGLQGYLFYQAVLPGIDAANQHLYGLVEETESLRLQRRVEDGLNILTQAGGENAAAARASLEVGEALAAVMGGTPKPTGPPVPASLAALAQSASPLQDTAVAVRSALAELQTLHTDHYVELDESWKEPPWYLWPTALLWTRWDPSVHRVITFDRAVYLARTGRLQQAELLLGTLTSEEATPDLRARAAYMIARLKLQSFAVSGEEQAFTAAIQGLEQSLVTVPGFVPSKRLLEFLLSFDTSEDLSRAVTPEGEADQQGPGDKASAPKQKSLF